MKKTWFSVGQIVVTLIVVVIAALVLWKLIAYYMFAPWTRDGHVRADVIEVAPDVSGLITSVQVVDNQPVQRGQVLFVIDQARYTLALREAEAAVVQRRATVEQQHAVIEQQRAGIQQQRATLDQARREDTRNRGLGNLVAKETGEESHTKVEQAEAGVATAQAGLANAQAALDVAQAALANAEVSVNTAQLNLQRTTVVSPVDGYLNDRAPRVGEYTAAGHAVLAVVDLHSFRVDGYFEETKLRGIHIGEPVDIEVMGEPHVLRGHVVSIVAAIEDRDRQPSSNLLPNVNPSFSWVRLAQRIPVRVALDEVPDDFRMIAGRTATVSVRDGSRDNSRRAASDAQAASAPGSGAAGGSADGATAASAAAASGQRVMKPRTDRPCAPAVADADSARNRRTHRADLTDRTRPARLRSLLPALLPALLALSGCINVGPDYKLPGEAAVNAPQANGPIAGASSAPVVQEPVPAKWWRLYDDPVLDQLVEAALASNTDLRVAAANLARSRAAFDVADQQGGFSGKASAAFARAQESGEQYLLTTKVPVVNEGDLDLSVSYEFDLFGKLRRGVEAARADSEATADAAETARITVVADVVRAYVQACSAAEELDIAQRSLALQKQRVELSSRLRDAGRGNQPDVTRGQTQADSLAADIPHYVGERQLAQYRLAMLLARSPADLPPAALACTKPPALTQPIPVGDGAGLLKRRPDVRQAERQLAASTARIGVATAALYPSISFGASTGFVGVLEDIPSQPTARWSFGPLISWNFPVNGQRARIRETEAATSGALAHFDGVVLNALRETQSSLATYAADAQRDDALHTTLQSATQSADETHRFYVAGRESFLSDLDATRTLTSVQAQVAAADAQVATDQVNLFLALGGGWEADDQTTAKAGTPAQAAAASAASGAAVVQTSSTAKP